VVAIIVAFFVILVNTTLWSIDMNPTCDSMMSHDKTEDIIAGIAALMIESYTGILYPHQTEQVQNVSL
jgi:hypothetical protein